MALKDEIVKKASNVLDKLNCPGALIRIDDEINGNMALGIGYADLNFKTVMPQDGQFYIYSPSKTFTSVCVLKLVEQNKLRLEHSVADYFPQFGLDGRITIRHLLNHTSGIVDYCRLRDYHDAVAASPNKPWTLEYFLEQTLIRGQDFTPGENWAYSNTNYLLLLLLIQKLTNSSYHDAIHQMIIEPLNLSQTHVAVRRDDDLQLVPAFAAFRSDSELVDIRPQYHPGWCATGVIVSTTKALLAFYKALFTGRLLSDLSLQKMKQLIKVPGSHPPAVTPSYGLGVMSDPDFLFGQSFGHGGSGPGYNVWVEYFPDLNGRAVSLCIVCNKTLNDHPHQLRIKLLELIK